MGMTDGRFGWEKKQLIGYTKKVNRRRKGLEEESEGEEKGECFENY